MWWKRGVDVGGCAVLFWDFLACLGIRPPHRSARAHHQQFALGGSEHLWAMCCSQCRLNRMRRSTERNVGPEEGSGNVFREARGTGQTSTEERLSCCSVGASLRRPVTAHFFLFQPSIYFAAKHFLHTSQCVTQLTILTQHLVISKITFQSPLGPIFLVKARKFTLCFLFACLFPQLMWHCNTTLHTHSAGALGTLRDSFHTLNTHAQRNQTG